jgi:exoribonuclease-2
MPQGRVVEFIDQREIVLSVCLKDRGDKLQLLTSSNHEVSIAPKRTLLISSTTLNISRPRDALIRDLKTVETRRIALMAKVSVRDLWELIREDNEAFSYEYLAQLSFGADVTDDHISALVRAVFADRLYFKMKQGSFVPNSPDKVEQIGKAREAAEIREREINEGAKWLKEVIANRFKGEPPLKGRIIEILMQLALYGKDAQDFKLGKEMFSRAGIKDIGQARHLLVKAGVWCEDQNIDLHRLKIRIDFSDPCLKEAQGVIKKQIDHSDREDVTELSIFTIDGPFTRDFDDALSLQPLDGGCRVGVHITDLAPFIEVDGCLDVEASRRASSVYLPANQIPMLPPSLSSNVLSLVKGPRRLAITLFADFDRHWNLTSYRFTPTVVRVDRQLTYDQVNAMYADEPIFSTLYELSQALRQMRAANGALLIPLPEIHFEFDNNTPVRIRLIEQETPARIIVSECMIMYNWLAAKFAAETALPILYRSQEPPQERLSRMSPTISTMYFSRGGNFSPSW